MPKFDDGGRRQTAKFELIPGIKLTMKQWNFVHAMVDKDSDTYLNMKRSAEEAGYGTKYAYVMGRYNMDLDAVQRALRDCLLDEDIDQLLVRGVKHRLKDPESKYWQETATFAAKVRGDFAPEKHVNVTLTPGERDEKMRKIEQLVGDNPIPIEDGDEDSGSV